QDIPMRKLFQILRRNPVLALVDVALINAGFILAFLLRFGADIRVHKVNLAEYVDVLPPASVLAVLLFYIGSLYGRWQDRSRTDLVSAISTAAGGILISTMVRSEEHTSELQSRENLVCRLLLEKKKPA